MIETISGTVIHGDALGKKLGFPTANIQYISDILPSAVFKVHIEIDGTLYTGMGVHAVWKETFEVHIFDFDADIYGKEVTVYLLKQIRKNRQFDSLDALSEQLQKDKEYIENIDLTVLTFGSFDVIHPGHHYYLSEAKKYGDTLITVVASDVNIERIKGHSPTHNESIRVKEVVSLGISDTVILGSNDNPMKWLHTYKPDTVCLGYDQRGPFVEKLSDELQKLGLGTEIVRVPALQPEKYKSSLLKNSEETKFILRKFQRNDYQEYSRWYEDIDLNKNLGPIDNKWLEYVLSNESGYQYSVFLQNKLIAVVGITFPTTNYKSYYITDFAVSPSLRGKEFGSKILKKILGLYPLEEGHNWIVFVSKSNPKGRKFFEKNGWVCSEKEANEHGMYKLYYQR